MPPTCVKFSCFSWRIVLKVPVKVIQQKNAKHIINVTNVLLKHITQTVKF